MECFIDKKKFSLRSDYFYFISPMGLGDTMMLCGLKNAVEQKFHGKIYFFIKPSHEVIMKMYDLHDYQVVDMRDFDLKQLGKISGSPALGKLFVAHPIYTQNNELLNEFRKKEYSFIEFYEKFLGLDGEISFQSPKVYPELSSEIRNRLPQNFDKLILLAPEANSSKIENLSFFSEIISKAKKQGYVVLINVTDLDNILDGTYYLPLSLSDTVALSTLCKEVHSVRSGLCDLIVGKCRKLTVYYNDKNNQRRYTLKQFPYHKNVKEKIIQGHRNIFNIISIRKKKNKIYYKFLGGFPLLKIQVNKNIKKIYLFNIFPIIKIIN